MSDTFVIALPVGTRLAELSHELDARGLVSGRQLFDGDEIRPGDEEIILAQSGAQLALRVSISIDQPARVAGGGFQFRRAQKARMRDARLPPPGTILRHVSKGNAVECVVADNGLFEFDGGTYRSLTEAARDAAKKLGLSPTVNGFLFWGLGPK